MRFPRTGFLLALAALLGACGGNETTEPQVVSIVVSPPSPTATFLGATVQFSAEARDGDGSVVSGVSFTWSSSDATVASVDASGRATALTAGAADITASAEGVSGSASLAVSPAPCTEEVGLEPGEFEVLPANCAIFIPSGASGDRYRVAVVNQNLLESASAVTPVTLNVQEAATAATAPLGYGVAADQVLLPGGPGAPVERIRLSPKQAKHLRWAEMLRDRTRETHRRIRAAEMGIVQALGTDGVLPDRRSEVLASADPARQSTLPDRLELRANPGTSCSIEEQLAPALLLAQNDLMAVYQDSAQNANAATEVTVGQAQQILQYYQDYGNATIDTYFPGLPDVDGNGKVVLYISFNDGLEDGATAAYVWGGDLFRADGSDGLGGCPASNEREMMYFNAALARALDDDFEQALETAVHEVKHIVSFWHGTGRFRRVGGTGAFQPSWVEEGTAEIAGNMSSRRAWAAIGGPAPNAMVVAQDFQDATANNGGSLPPEVLGVLIRMSRAQNYLASQPNGIVVTPNGARSGSSVYGSGWTFFRWLGDVYGNAGTAPYADNPFFASQVDSATNAGTAGLETLTGKTFQELLEEFSVGVMSNGTAAGGGVLDYTSYDFPDAIEIWCFASSEAVGNCSGTGPVGVFPWPVTSISETVAHAGFTNDEFTGDIGATGMRIHEFLSSGEPGGIALNIQAVQPAKVVVLRVQ